MTEAFMKPIRLTHVQYSSNDLKGMFLAYCSLIPILLIQSFATLILIHRDMQMVVLLAGQLFNEGVNYLLKQHFQEPRPIGIHQGTLILTRRWIWHAVKPCAIHVFSHSLLVAALPALKANYFNAAFEYSSGFVLSVYAH